MAILQQKKATISLERTIGFNEMPAPDNTSEMAQDSRYWPQLRKNNSKILFISEDLLIALGMTKNAWKWIEMAGIDMKRPAIFGNRCIIAGNVS